MLAGTSKTQKYPIETYIPIASVQIVTSWLIVQNLQTDP
jgi:hypothetical protein